MAKPQRVPADAVYEALLAIHGDAAMKAATVVNGRVFRGTALEPVEEDSQIFAQLQSFIPPEFTWSPTVFPLDLYIPDWSLKPLKMHKFVFLLWGQPDSHPSRSSASTPPPPPGRRPSAPALPAPGASAFNPLAF